MTNLGIAGAVSLGTVNQWISLIDTNLTNSKRIGYKETRVSMTSGEVNTVGMTQGPGKIMPIAFPSASLLIGKTQILDYVQGNLTQTGQITDFALNGKGYFVVEDDLGNRYATRDGQFNFDTDGYLVTQEGLKVLTSGMDYFRVPASETFAVNTSGESQYNSIDSSVINNTFNPANGVASLSTSVYGTKKLLVIEIPDSEKLIYSKYGYTKFDLGKRVPIIVRNDFSTTTDGLSPDLCDVINAAGINTTNFNQYFKHDIKNGVLKMSTHVVNGPPGWQPNRYVQASVTAQKMKDMDLSMDFHVRDGGLYGTTSETEFGFTFGKDKMTSTDQDSYFVGLSGTQFVIRKNNGAPLGAVGFPDAATDPANVPTINPANKMNISLSINNGVINASLTIGNTKYVIPPISAPLYSGGFVSFGTTTNTTFGALGGNASSALDNVIDITNLTVVERNQDSEYTTNVIQQNIKDIWRDGANAQERESLVMQQYVEESTSTLADTLPLLSHAQKMFSAISKVISVYNSITDDMNNTVR